MYTNLFICNLFKKKVIQEDEFLLIPICLFDFFQNRQYPGSSSDLPCFIHFDTSLNKVMLDQCYLTFKSQNYDNDGDGDGGGDDICRCCNMICAKTTRMDGVTNMKNVDIKFNHITKMLLLCMDCLLESVSLSLNGLEPFTWSNEQLLKKNIYGKIVYVIPLSPDLTSFKSIKKSLDCDKIDGTGINFSRIDTARLSIKTELPDDQKFSVDIVGLHHNVYTYNAYHGMLGLLYTT
jgi:hypothetical protein